MTTENTAKELRVAAHTGTTELASAIANAIAEDGTVLLRAIGAASVNQAVKGIAKAQGYVAQQGSVLSTRFGFLTIDLHGESKTAMLFHVFKA